MAHSSLRFGIGRFTTEAEIDFVVDHIVKTVHKLREMRCVRHETNVRRALTLHLVLYGKWFRRALISILLIGLNTSLIMSFNICSIYRSCMPLLMQLYSFDSTLRLKPYAQLVRALRRT